MNCRSLMMTIFRGQDGKNGYQWVDQDPSDMAEVFLNGLGWEEKLGKNASLSK